MKSKICTTIDQCKKLLDLEIDINTADLTVTNYPLQDGSRFDFICCKLPNDIFPSITDGKSEKIPAWSLSALLDLMQKKGILIALRNSPFNQQWSVSCDIDDIWKQCKGDTPIDAAFEMACWLKENKYI